MATWDDVRRLALALPEAAEGTSRDGLPGWSVRDRSFAWERPLRRGDLQALGDAAPQGPILAARVPDLGAKEALLADDGEVYFTTPALRRLPGHPRAAGPDRRPRARGAAGRGVAVPGPEAARRRVPRPRPLGHAENGGGSLSGRSASLGP